MNRTLDTIRDMFGLAHTTGTVFPPTMLYNEGWMLRLVLSLEARGCCCLPFRLEAGSRWFSEALLYTPFYKRERRDQLAEGCTHADGVVGRFDFAPGTKCGLELHAETTQFDVVEAKMYSRLKGVKNAPSYSQAARYVACIAHTLSRARLRPHGLKSLGFYVFAPEEFAQVHRALLDRSLLLYAIRERSAKYPAEEQPDRNGFLAEYVEPMLKSEHFEIECVTWESIIRRLKEQHADLGAEMDGFYERCKSYNRTAPNSRKT